jgi:hypothetical protein
MLLVTVNLVPLKLKSYVMHRKPAEINVKCQGICTKSKEIKHEEHLELQILQGLNTYHHVKYKIDLIKCLLH